MPLWVLSEGGSYRGQGPVERRTGGIHPSPPPGQLKCLDLSRASRTGERVQQPTSEADKTVPCSARIILECGCGEQLILLGLEEDWRSEQRTEFDCSCGKGLTISINRLNEDVLTFRQLIRGAREIHRN